MVRLVTAPLALLLLSLCLTWAAMPADAAGPGSVSIQPAVAFVPSGGTSDIAVILNPPAETVSVFIIEIAYDPTVVPFVECVPWDVDALPSTIGAAGCDAKDTDGDAINDTAVVFGAYVENHDGTPVGFSTPQTVGTITFEALGKKGDASPLILSACDDCILAPTAEVLLPTFTNGSISIIGNRGPSRHFPPWCSASWTKGGEHWPAPQPGARQCPAGQ
jgi:hypothetical protein